MSEQLATAQPEAFAPEATPAPSAEPTPASQAQVDTVKATATRSLEDELGDIFDKNNAPPAPQKAAADAAPTSDQPEKAEPEPAQSSPAIAAPHSWSAEAKADWAKLPPSTQAYIAQRESEAHKAITQAGTELKTYQPLRQVFDQFQGYYPQGQEAQFVASLMQANAALHHDPVGTLKQLAEYYRVDPAQLTGQKPPQPSATDTVDDLFRDPRLDKEVMPLVQTMAQRVQQLEGQLTARQRAEAEARQADASKTIAEFSKDKPDFAALHDDIVREVSLMNPRMPMEKRLAEAYDRARWANPENRQRILDEQRRTEAEKAQKEAAAKQAEAKKHASMNVRSGANAPTPSTGSKWNDESNLGALYDRITARG